MLSSTNINANTIMLVCVLILGLLFAIVVGDSVASGRYLYLGLFALLGVGVSLLLKLGSNYWLLVVLAVPANERLGFLPGPLQISELCAIAGALGFTLQVVKRRAGPKAEWRLMDVIVLVNAVWLIVTFIKNPVGVAMFGSDIVGGRKYLGLFFAFLAYYILSRSRIPASWGGWLTVVIAVAWALPAALRATALAFPELGSIISRVYALQLASDAAGLFGGSSGPIGTETRLFGAESVAKPLFLALCAYYPPITFLNPLHPMRFLGFLLSFVVAGLSGFRTALLAVGGYMLIATLIRGRARDLLPLAAAGILGVVGLGLAVQSGAAIPFTIQRALSFVPLGWDTRATDDAEGTTRWRLDMWRTAWNDPNYFKDKVFGDGFGFTYQEMVLFANQMQGTQGLLGVDNTYELFIIRGSLHNGPLSSIRYGGFIGLILLTALMIATASYGVQVAKTSAPTNFAPLALFAAIPLVYEVFAFYFIFGAYDNHIEQFVIGAGMLNLISRSLPKDTTRSVTSLEFPSLTPTALSEATLPAPAVHHRSNN